MSFCCRHPWHELLQVAAVCLSLKMAIKGAAASGTPFVSFFSMEEAKGPYMPNWFKNVQTISTKEMTERYFKDRSDHLVPASGELFLVAGT
jgi:hypothetical protein